MAITLILLNGLPGSGKSTLGRWLAERLGAAVLFDVDDVTRVYPFEFNDYVLFFGVDNLALLVNNSQAIGVDHAVLCGGLWRQDLLDRFVARVPGCVLVYIWLKATAATRCARKAARGRDGADLSSEFSQIDVKFTDPAGIDLPDGVITRVDTEGRTLDAVGEEVLRLMRAR
jgi:gluconate kinase